MEYSLYAVSRCALKEADAVFCGGRDDADRELDQGGSGGAVGRTSDRRWQTRTDFDETSPNVERRSPLCGPVGGGAVRRMNLNSGL